MTIRTEAIDAVQKKWGEALNEAKLTSEEGVTCASQWLANVIMSVSAEYGEKNAHELLNRCTEISHIYINENWRGIMEVVQQQQAASR